MQSYKLDDVQLNSILLAVPSNCTGVSTGGGNAIFWFAADDMTVGDTDAIDIVVAAHKYGRIVIVPSGDDYLVTIYTTAVTDVTISIDETALPIQAVVDGKSSIIVSSLETFTISVLEIDVEDLTHVIN